MVAFLTLPRLPLCLSLPSNHPGAPFCSWTTLCLSQPLDLWMCCSLRLPCSSHCLPRLAPSYPWHLETNVYEGKDRPLPGVWGSRQRSRVCSNVQCMCGQSRQSCLPLQPHLLVCINLLHSFKQLHSRPFLKGCTVIYFNHSFLGCCQRISKS